VSVVVGGGVHSGGWCPWWWVVGWPWVVSVVVMVGRERSSKVRERGGGVVGGQVREWAWAVGRGSGRGRSGEGVGVGGRCGLSGEGAGEGVSVGGRVRERARVVRE
jgi:hypothetical protein